MKEQCSKATQRHGWKPLLIHILLELGKGEKMIASLREQLYEHWDYNEYKVFNLINPDDPFCAFITVEHLSKFLRNMKSAYCKLDEARLFVRYDMQKKGKWSLESFSKIIMSSATRYKSLNHKMKESCASPGGVLDDALFDLFQKEMEFESTMNHLKQILLKVNNHSSHNISFKLADVDNDRSISFDDLKILIWRNRRLLKHSRNISGEQLHYIGYYFTRGIDTQWANIRLEQWVFGMTPYKSFVTDCDNSAPENPPAISNISKNTVEHRNVTCETPRQTTRLKAIPGSEFSKESTGKDRPVLTLSHLMMSQKPNPPMNRALTIKQNSLKQAQKRYLSPFSTPIESTKSPRKDKFHSSHRVDLRNNLKLRSSRESPGVLSLDPRKCESIDTLKSSTHSIYSKLGKVSFHEEVQPHSGMSGIRAGLQDEESNFGMSNKSFHNSNQNFRETSHSDNFLTHKLASSTDLNPGSNCKTVNQIDGDLWHVSSKPIKREHENESYLVPRYYGTCKDLPNKNVTVTPVRRKLQQTRSNSCTQLDTNADVPNTKPPLHPSLKNYKRKNRTSKSPNGERLLGPSPKKCESTHMFEDTPVLARRVITPEKKKCNKDVFDVTPSVVYTPTIVQSGVCANKSDISVTISPTENSGTFLVSFNNTHNSNKEKEPSHRVDDKKIGYVDQHVGTISQTTICKSLSVNDLHNPAHFERKGPKFCLEKSVDSMTQGELTAKKYLKRDTIVIESDHCNNKNTNSPTKLHCLESRESYSMVFPVSTKPNRFIRYKNKTTQVTPKHSAKAIQFEPNSPRKRNLPVPESLGERMEHLKNEKYVSNTEAMALALSMAGQLSQQAEKIRMTLISTVEFSFDKAFNELLYYKNTRRGISKLLEVKEQVGVVGSEELLLFFKEHDINIFSKSAVDGLIARIAGDRNAKMISARDLWQFFTPRTVLNQSDLVQKNHELPGGGEFERDNSSYVEALLSAMTDILNLEKIAQSLRSSLEKRPNFSMSSVFNKQEADPNKCDWVTVLKSVGMKMSLELMCEALEWLWLKNPS